MKLNWSRRELEALGEPLGDCVTMPKLGGGWICGGGGKGGGGGGGGPQQVTSTTTTSNIPEYAKPYVENMLQSAQAQIYSGDMSTFRPYQPYSTDVNQYFAPFSPMQQQAQQAAYYMTSPEQIQQGSELAGLGGLGSLALAGQAAGAGQQYAQQATDPYAIQAYMSPYQQNVTDVAKAAAVREAQIAQNTQNLAAARQGTYGGARQTLAQAERERNLLANLSNIQAQGSQNAFQQAQQAQQFGAGLGLQGLQAGLGGLGQATSAGTALGGLGAQQLGAQQNIINLQSTLGAQQQSLEQQKINQAIQDYATAQQYPFMQLGMLNAMLRGLPLQAMTTQGYQAAPSYLTQGLGALGTIGGAMKAFGREGGEVKGLAAGGEVKGYAPGGDVVGGIRAKLQAMDEAQLTNVIRTSTSDEVREMAAEILNEKRMAEQTEQQIPKMPTQQAAENAGIAALPAPSMDEMAGGGIVAFAPGGDVDEEDMVPYVEMARKARAAAGVTDEANKEYKEFMAKQVAGLPQMKEQEKGLMMMDYFSRLGSTPGSLLYAGLTAAKESAPGFRSSLDKIKKAEADVMKGQADLAQADRLEKLGLAKEAAALRKDQLDREKALDVANINARAAMASANRPTDLDKTTTAEFNALVAGGADPKDPRTMQKARTTAIEKTGLSLRKVEATENAAITTAIAKSDLIGDKGTLTQELKILKLKKSTPETQAKIDELEDKIEAEKAAIINRVRRQESRQSTPNAAPAPGAAPAMEILPMPAKQEDAVKGKIYNTARGPATWDGTKFVPVRQQ